MNTNDDGTRPKSVPKAETGPPAEGSGSEPKEKATEASDRDNKKITTNDALKLASTLWDILNIFKG